MNDKHEKIACEYCRSAGRKLDREAGTCNWTLAPHCEKCCLTICDPNWKPFEEEPR